MRVNREFEGEKNLIKKKKAGIQGMYRLDKGKLRKTREPEGTEGKGKFVRSVR